MATLKESLQCGDTASVNWEGASALRRCQREHPCWMLRLLTTCFTRWLFTTWLFQRKTSVAVMKLRNVICKCSLNFTKLLQHKRFLQLFAFLKKTKTFFVIVYLHILCYTGPTQLPQRFGSTEEVSFRCRATWNRKWVFGDGCACYHSYNKHGCTRLTWYQVKWEQNMDYYNISSVVSMLKCWYCKISISYLRTQISF